MRSLHPGGHAATLWAYDPVGRFTSDSIRRGGMVIDSLGRDLREARKRSGMPFHKFARLAGFSESHLRSAENGHRAVTRQIAGAYDHVLATGGIFQEALDETSNHSMGESLTAAPLPWDESGTLSAISGALNRSDVDRREFVAASGAALAALIGDWRSALSAPAPLAEAGRSRQAQQAVSLLQTTQVELAGSTDPADGGDARRTDSTCPLQGRRRACMRSHAARSQGGTGSGAASRRPADLVLGDWLLEMS